MTILTELKFNIEELLEGENNLIATYTGKTDDPEIILELEVLDETRVMFCYKDKLVSKRDIPNKLTNEIDDHDENVCIKVPKKPIKRTSVFIVLRALKDNSEKAKFRGSIYF
jgi:hypothetical protein